MIYIEDTYKEICYVRNILAQFIKNQVKINNLIIKKLNEIADKQDNPNSDDPNPKDYDFKL